MQRNIFVEKNIKEFLETNNGPGVFGFINLIEKQVWISYTENISEAITRNIKSIRQRQHKVKSLVGWEVLVFSRDDNKRQAKNQFRIICQDYRSKGIEVLNKEHRYRLWGTIEKDFREGVDGFLYYLWAGTKNKRMALIGLFEKAKEGEKFLTALRKGSYLELPDISKNLLRQYKNNDNVLISYKRLFQT